MKRIVIIIALLLASLAMLQAQVGNTLAVPVGSRVPAVNVEQMLDHEKPVVPLSELYRGKLLIIEFWATYCGTCLGFMPVIESLQQQFREEVQVLAVTMEPRQAVNKLLERMPQLRQTSLLRATGDRLLFRLFPNRLVPHLVWIDSTGTLLGTTSHEEATQENIQAVLRGDLSVLKPKRDKVDFDWRKPFRAEDSALRYRSLLTGYDAGIGGGIALLPASSFIDTVKRFFAWNQSIFDLYYFAYLNNVVEKPNFNRVVLEVADSFSLMYPGERLAAAGYASYDEWRKQHKYVYERMYKEGVPKKVFFEGMMAELNQYFPYEARIEKRKIPVWELTRRKGWKLPPSQLEKERFIGMVPSIDSAKGIYLYKLAAFLSTSPVGPPIIDKTGYTYRLDLEIDLPDGPQKPIDFKAWQAVLRKQGIRLRQKVRPYPVLIIRDKK